MTLALVKAALYDGGTEHPFELGVRLSDGAMLRGSAFLQGDILVITEPSPNGSGLIPTFINPNDVSTVTVYMDFSS